MFEGEGVFVGGWGGGGGKGLEQLASCNLQVYNTTLTNWEIPFSEGPISIFSSSSFVYLTPVPCLYILGLYLST